MLHRIVRPTFLTLFILTGLAAAGFLWSGGQRITSTHTQTSVAVARADALIAGLTDLRAALQAYVAPGQSVSSWAERSAAVLAQMGEDLGALERLPESAATVEAVRPAIASLAKSEERVREYLRSGDDLMAADLAFNEAGETASTAVTALRDWRAQQQSASATAVSRIETRQMAALGALVLAWSLSLVLVWKRPEPSVAESSAAIPAAERAPAEVFDPVVAPVTVADGPVVDLQAAAQACEAFARAGDGSALKAALGLGAEALGAKGIVVWLGVDEQLFAVASHGYDERHLKRPIARGAQNVTAETWRTGQAVTIPADGDAPGVVVVPMADAAGCRGVVSAELLPGRVAAADRQALLSMFAAQLGGIVGASAPVSVTAPAPAPVPVAAETAFDELASAIADPAAPAAAERAS